MPPCSARRAADGVDGERVIAIVAKHSSGRGARDDSYWANAEASSDRLPPRSARMLSEKALALGDQARRPIGSREL
jgi:hypothetical protein